MPNTGLTLYATVNGQQIGDGTPILTCMGGDIVLTELNQFSASSVVLAAADQQTILAMQPYTLIEIVQEGVGTLAWGYVLNPQEQITDRDEHTITLQLEPVTVEATWHRTRRGWIAANYLSVIASRLGALTPGWAGRYTLAGGSTDITISVTLDDTTALGGFLQVAQQFSQFARMGTALDGSPKDVLTGLPIRILEMGPFGGAPSVTLTDGKGSYPDALGDNETIRVVASVQRTPNDVTNLINVVAPVGGGSSPDTLVTLERLWRIINDPTYPNVGRWGSDADSIARTGHPSAFPEYDTLYPISDPTIPATGAPIYDANGNLLQGGNTTRGITLDGHFDYRVYDSTSYALYGHKEGQFVESGINYADNSIANQELSQRALYVATVAQLKRYSHPHHMFTCTAPVTGASRPTRAGDLVAVDYQRISVNDRGAVVEMNVIENLRVMRVTRTFDQNGSEPVDTYVLSNLGRFDDDDASAAADVQRAMAAIQLNTGTGLAKDSVVIRDNIDALNPITHWLYIAPEHYRYHQVRVRCDFFAFRGTATTAVNSAATITITGIDHGSHAISGTFPSQPAPVSSLDSHVHFLTIAANTGGTANVHVALSGSDGLFGATSGGGGQVSTTLPHFDTNHAHNTTLAAAPVTPQHTTLTGPLPQHTHDVEKRIPTGQPSPASITMTINGQGLSSGKQATGTRNGAGAFTSSFVVTDIGPELDAFAPGTDVPIQFFAGAGAGNPNGVGYIVITITSSEELGGLTSTVRAV